MSSPAPPEEDPYASLFKSRQKTPPPAETPRSYRVRSEETWAAAREDYECGWSAEEVCRRYDLGLSAFRQRARREEWRRCDQPEPEPLPPFPAEPEAALSDEQLLDLAQRSLSSAVRRGRVYEARAWMRLIAELKQRARQAAESAAYRQRLAALKAKRAEEAEPEPQPADEDAPKNAHVVLAGVMRDLADAQRALTEAVEEVDEAEALGELHGLHSGDGVQSAAAPKACHPRGGAAEPEDPASGTVGAAGFSGLRSAPPENDMRGEDGGGADEDELHGLHSGDGVQSATSTAPCHPRATVGRPEDPASGTLGAAGFSGLRSASPENDIRGE